MQHKTSKKFPVPNAGLLECAVGHRSGSDAEKEATFFDFFADSPKKAPPILAAHPALF